MKKFCVITTGRTGSTSLIDLLGSHSDISIPGKQLDSPDQELLHPKNRLRYAKYYADAVGTLIRNEHELINAFYSANGGYAYAGFKTMPGWHKELLKWAQLGHVKFITLERRDLPATVASFLAAQEFSTWRRSGGEQENTLTFGQHNVARVNGRIRYILSSQTLIAKIKNPINVFYEDICRRDFHHPELNEYFGREVALDSPREPLDPSTYLTNWSEFKTYVNRYAAAFRAKLV